MATEENKKETVVKPEKVKHVLLKEFVTQKKTYKRGETFSHDDANVIQYLKQNKFI